MNCKQISFISTIFLYGVLLHAAHEPTQASSPQPAPTASPTESHIELPPFPTPPIPIEYEEQEADKNQEAAGALAELSVEEAMKFLQKFIESNSEDEVVTVMKGVPIAKAKEIIQRIIASQATQPFKVTAILGVATYYANDKNAQHQLFALFNEHQSLSKGVPLISIAADSLYPDIITDLCTWADTQSARLSRSSLVDTALAYALKTNNVGQLAVIQQHTRLIDAAKASELLWRAVNDQRSADIISFLVAQGADLQQERDGKTLLIVAAQQLNQSTTEELLELAKKNKTIDLKKWVNRFVDPAVGTPLQKVMVIQKDEKIPEKNRKKAAQIELILRKNGATINEQ